MSEANPVFNPEYNSETGNSRPDVFDGFRFSRLREVPGHETKHQSVTTSVVSALTAVQELDANECRAHAS